MHDALHLGQLLRKGIELLCLSPCRLGSVLDERRLKLSQGMHLLLTVVSGGLGQLAPELTLETLVATLNYLQQTAFVEFALPQQIGQGKIEDQQAQQAHTQQDSGSHVL